jgi:putative ABC transport system ATP-binding protein
MRAAGDEQQRGNREARERTHGDSPGDDGGGIVPARRRARRAFSPNRRSAWPNGTVAGKRRRGFAERSHGAVRRHAVATCRSYRERHFIAELRNVDLATSPAPSARRPVVELRGVGKTYAGAQGGFTALTDLDLVIERGEFAAIVGQSGSGKSTLLNLIGCIDTPCSGSILIDGHDVAGRTPDQLSQLRARTVGFIFQTVNLLPVLSAEENIEYPLLQFRELSAKERRERVAQYLDVVQLSRFAKHRPNELSGGQRQRVAIARALATHPKIILADEPTANLDSKTGKSILSLMKDINRNSGATFVFSTHDKKVIAEADRLVRIEDGRIRRLGVRSGGTDWTLVKDRRGRIIANGGKT